MTTTSLSDLQAETTALRDRVGAFHEQLLTAGFTDPAPAQIARLAEQRDALADALESARLRLSVMAADARKTLPMIKAALRKAGR